MATYAIGDIQGCYDEFSELLQLIRFSPERDKLWLVGDLVNRGPKSLKTLRLIYDLRDNIQTVLGNHDLHLLAVAHSVQKLKKGDTLGPLLNAHDADTLLTWLSQQPLVHHDATLNYHMVHAGVIPQWTVSQALAYSKEVEDALNSGNASIFFSNMYGDQPDIWSDQLSGMPRLRFITNVLTRIRYCDNAGHLNLKVKGATATIDDELHPWFELRSAKEQTNKLVFGHWSTLPNIHGYGASCLDTGCVWGGQLTAMRLEDQAIFQVPSITYKRIK